MENKNNQDIAVELCTVVKKINIAWQEGRFEELNKYFHEEIVIATPNFEGGGQGREACIKSYKQFAKMAEIYQYDESNFNAVVWENTALVHYSFDMSYTLQGQEYRDQGFDLYVFTKVQGEWKAVWRTLLPKSVSA